MGEAPGTQAPRELLERLVREGRTASFFQAVELLEELFPEAPHVGQEGPAERERIRLRPSIALSCPPSDIESVEVLPDGRVAVTATFLGLYGVDSPLPYVYAEHLAQVAEEPSGVRLRAFLDLFHHRLYSLLYRAWRKSRPVAAGSEVDPLHDRVLAPIGYSHELGLGGARRPRLAEARMRVLRPRTAAGLEALLHYRLGYACPVDQLEARRALIPPDQRSRLGQANASLGSSLMVGAALFDRNKIQVRALATSFGMYQRLLPEGEDRRELDDALAGYLRDPLDYDLEVTLPSEHVPPLRLGQQGSLGRDAWLGVPRPAAVTTWRGKPLM